MEHDFWAERWRGGQTAFHLADVNRQLLAHAGQLAPGGATRVLVPLCGKSHDLAWLAAQGHEVVGVELVDQAVRELFAERGREPQVGRLGPHVCFRDERITLLVDDFLTLDREAVGGFPAIWDRAALVAIPPTEQARYLGKLRSLITDDGRILLVTFNHDMDSGPPFSLPEAALRPLCAGLFGLERLATHDILAEQPRFRERGATRAEEQVFLLRPLPRP